MVGIVRIHPSQVFAVVAEARHVQLLLLAPLPSPLLGEGVVVCTVGPDTAVFAVTKEPPRFRKQRPRQLSRLGMKNREWCRNDVPGS